MFSSPREWRGEKEKGEDEDEEEERNKRRETGREELRGAMDGVGGIKATEGRAKKEKTGEECEEERRGGEKIIKQR